MPKSSLLLTAPTEIERGFAAVNVLLVKHHRVMPEMRKLERRHGW